MIENSGSGRRSIVDNNDEESPYFVEESRNSLLTIPNVYRPLSLMKELQTCVMFYQGINNEWCNSNYNKLYPIPPV